MFQWRKFQFFDREPLTDDPAAQPAGQEKKAPPAAPAEKPADSTAAALFQSFEAACSSSGRGRLVFGDKKGVIRIVDRDFKALTFQAFDNDVVALQQLKRSNTLVSVGLDAGITLKIWRWDQFDTDGKPMLARALKLFPPGFDAKVSCFAVVEDISQLALGLGNGGVLLLDGNILRDRQPRQRWLVKEGPVVTGLHMAEEGSAVTLFVTTIAGVHSIALKAKAPVLRLLDEEGGADLTCSVLNEDRRLVVGREKAVYFYEAEEKGVCFGFEGLKKAIGWFNSYLYVVEEDRKDLSRNTLTIYDLKNKFIAFSAKFDTIVHTVAEWQSLFVVTANRQVWQLQEKDLPTKMNMLFKKNLYSIAISLAHSQNCDDVYVKDIFQKYGDHLYSKGDYDGAIVQYIDTIPFLEPSFVIRKFLDAQRIENLTKYLQALHEKGHADANHTTLLLNCYTKQKDLDKLAQFIQDPNVSFDVSTAIAVCRQAGNYHNKQAEYYNLALFLAHRKFQHDLYLQIQIDDLRNYTDALRYIWTLDYALASRFVREYGAKLVTELPAESTELLKALCTTFVPRKRDELVLGPGFVPVPSAPSSAPSSASAGSSLPSSASQSVLGSSPPAASARLPTSAPSETKDAPAKCKPEDFIHFFVGNSKHLRDFLEHIIDNESRVSGVVYNTVLELYMRQLEEEQNSEADLRAAQDKVMALLKSQNAKYDMDHALVLTKTYKFERGVTFLYEKLRLFAEIVQYHMDRGQGDKVLQACENHGDKNPQLWVQALSFFAAHPDPCDKEIVQVLRKIYEKKLLPPLMVVQVLARDPEKPLSVVKDFIIKALQEENAIIVADENELRGYQEETQQMRSEIEELRTSAAIFQGTKCHACTSGLELPVVHFLCRHSYHQRCLGDNERECLKCSEEMRKVSEMRKHMKASANQHDLFYKQLDDASDGFAVVSDYFGRGLFQFEENDPALRDPEPQQPNHDHDADDADLL